MLHPRQREQQDPDKETDARKRGYRHANITRRQHTGNSQIQHRARFAQQFSAAPGRPARFSCNPHALQTVQGLPFPGTGRTGGKGLQQNRFEVAQEMRRTVFAAVTQLVSVNQRSISRTAESRHQDQFHTGPQNGQPPDPDHGTKEEKQTQRQQTQQQGSRIAEHIRQGTEQPAGFFALRQDDAFLIQPGLIPDMVDHGHNRYSSVRM